RSVRANDFRAFFSSHPHIGTVFFNGAKAAMLYERLVLPTLPSAIQDCPRVILPSTSPAHASLAYAEKLKRWAPVREAALARSLGDPVARAESSGPAASFTG